MMTKARWLQPRRISAVEMLTKTSSGSPSIQPDRHTAAPHRPPGAPVVDHGARVVDAGDEGLPLEHMPDGARKNRLAGEQRAASVGQRDRAVLAQDESLEHPLDPGHGQHGDYGGRLAAGAGGATARQGDHRLAVIAEQYGADAEPEGLRGRLRDDRRQGDGILRGELGPRTGEDAAMRIQHDDVTQAGAQGEAAKKRRVDRIAAACRRGRIVQVGDHVQQAEIVAADLDLDRLIGEQKDVGGLDVGPTDKLQPALQQHRKATSAEDGNGGDADEGDAAQRQPLAGQPLPQLRLCHRLRLDPSPDLAGSHAR